MFAAYEASAVSTIPTGAMSQAGHTNTQGAPVGAAATNGDNHNTGSAGGGGAAGPRSQQYMHHGYQHRGAVGPSSRLALHSGALNSRLVLHSRTTVASSEWK